MIRAAAVVIALGALAASAPLAAATRAVPFVGCPSDGQVGPLPSPASSKVPRAPESQAARLAYYAMGEGEVGLGILAPRGWHCVGLYGSDGKVLIVTPDKHSAEEFFAASKAGLRSPAVEVRFSFGGTSGRYAVMNAIGRYFPGRRDYLRQMEKEGLVFSPLPTGPFVGDRIRARTPTRVRFTTPANRKGEGTDWRLAPGREPVEGILIILDGEDGPSLLGVNVRLPPSQRGLTETILSSAGELQ